MRLLIGALGLAVGISLWASLAAAETVEITASEDAWIYGAVPGVNYGADDTLELSGATAQYKRQILLKFDLSSLSGLTDVSVVSAQVVLECRAQIDWGGNLPARFHAADADWQESTVTWINAPSASTVVSDTLTLTPAYADPWRQRVWTLNQDGLDLVAGWIAGQPSYGFKMLPEDPGVMTHTQEVRSREAADPADRPKLVIQYLAVIPVEAVDDLSLLSVETTSLLVQWTSREGLVYEEATGYYELRYSTAPIDENNFDSATLVSGVPQPLPAGTVQSCSVDGLLPETTYYIAIKGFGPYEGLISDLSNVLVAETEPPDTTPPAAVDDLSATTVDSRWLVLGWSATGDDGISGLADAYDVRYSTYPLTEESFSAATPVAQNLTPQAPGQTETLTVTGLTPSITYYFAVKVSDEVPNVSVISNVLEVATLPPDVTPPAAISDLSVTSVDDKSVQLSWTAPGDDGTAGLATGYDLRYSTAPIDDGNWDQAAPVAGLPAPLPAGSTQQFTVIGLLPLTEYFFGLKTSDEENNTSALSNIATTTTAEPPLVTSVVIADKAGVTTVDYPVTLSLVFRKGDVPANVTARIAGQMLATQTDVKVRYDDQSVKHALVSFIIPLLPASQQVTVDILGGGGNADSDYFDQDELLATDFEALMSLTVGGNSYSASARQMLVTLTDPRYWIKGDICTEVLLVDLGSNIENQLNVQYYVRLYPGWDGIRIDTVVENCWSDYRGNITYDFDLQLGYSTPATVLQKTNFTHNVNARWRKIFWLGHEPPEVEVRYDLDYTIATGTLPRYDTSLTVPDSTLQSAYDWWASSGHDIMEGGRIMRYFPSSGGREDIGVYPAWAARYLLSMDNRLREVMLNYGDLSGSIPVHIRESDPGRAFHQHVLSIDDRPTVWTGWWDFGPTSEDDRLPAPIGPTDTEWSVDGAHQPSFACVPYLVTGDYYYLEEMYFWAGWDLSDTNYSVRGYDAGWIHDQARGIAWRNRNLADAANMAPDADVLEKSYFTEKVLNNIAHWDDIYISGYYPTVRYLQIISPADRAAPEFDPNVAFYSLPWQDNYVLMVAGHMRDIGFDTDAMIAWLGESLINQYRHPDMNWYRASPYKLATHLDDGAGGAAVIETWAEVNDAFVDDEGPTWFEGYYHNEARAALTYVVHMPQGLAAWNWLDAGIYNPQQTATDPKWAFLPYVPGDIDGDYDVDLDDYAALCAAMTAPGVPTSDQFADLDGDGDCDLADVALFVAGFSGAL